jgi:hypothetical protein
VKWQRRASVRVNTTSNALKERWLVLVILALTLTVASVGGLACKSDGTVLSDNSSITTVTEPSGYIQVEVRPAKIMAKIGQRVRVQCAADPIINTPVTVVSVELALFDSGGALLRKQVLDLDTQQGSLVRHTTYHIVGDEVSYKLFIVFDVGKIMDDPGTRYSEYTVASMPIAITK